MTKFNFFAIVATAFFLLLVAGCEKKEPPRPPWTYGSNPVATPAMATTTPAKTPLQGSQFCLGGPCPPIGPTGSTLTLDKDGVPIIGITETGKVIETTPASGIEHGVRQVSSAARFGTAWVLLALGILIPGPLVILLIPGFITGRAEKVLEGLALCAWGLFMLNLSADAEVGSLFWWVWGVLVIPGALLLLWGLVSDNESGKFVLVTGPVIVFGLYLFSQIYRMVVLGAAGSAIITFVILILVAAVLLGAISRLAGTSSA